MSFRETSGVLKTETSPTLQATHLPTVGSYGKKDIQESPLSTGLFNRSPPSPMKISDKRKLIIHIDELIRAMPGIRNGIGYRYEMDTPYGILLISNDSAAQN